MYFKRKIDDFLLNWKEDISHKPLIIKGARQIGKTESILHFAGNVYANIVYINFVLDKRFRAIVSDGYDVDTVIKNISLVDPNLKFVPGETVIIFDEIQEYPDVATCLKSFNIDRRFDIICSGSMLGINYKKIHSNSVGNKTDYEMYSMDFEEFLWAVGDEITADTIKLLLKSKKSAGNAMHRNLMRMFRLYMLIGGMPQAVEAYLEHNNPKGDKINPIEVKSGNYRGHKSLDVFCDKYSSRIRDKYVVHTKDYKWENGIHYLPVYMIPFL